MEQINLNWTEYLVYAAMLNAAIGLILGLLPLILGIVKKQRSLGVYGFIGSIFGGAILGILLSIPVVGIFTYLILKKSKPEAVNPDNVI